jgi:hypothetical protein
MLFIYGSLFLNGVYYCLGVFWCAIARMSELLVKLDKSGSEIREMLVQWTMPSSGMWRHTVPVWTEVSVERIASNFRVEKSASDEPAWSVSYSCSSWFLARGFSTLKTEAIRSSETSVYTWSTWRNIPEDCILPSHPRENLKSYLLVQVCGHNAKMETQFTGGWHVFLRE